MRAQAITKYVRMSPRKVRLVTTVIQGRQVEEALAMLRFMPQEAAFFVAKTVKSAAANAESTYQLGADELFVLEARADDGPRLKRWRPRARGRADRIIKRTSHITVVVSEREEQ